MESVMRLFVGYAVIAQSIAGMDHTQPSSDPGPAALWERLVAAQADHDEFLLGTAAHANARRATRQFDRPDAGGDRRVSAAEPE